MTRLRVGITGQIGFMGYHLYYFLVREGDVQLIDFEDEYFRAPGRLQSFVEQCDVIVHLAAMNKGDEREIYETNVALVQNLITAAKTSKKSPLIVFASSTQQSLDNPYGRSKRKGQEILETWAKETGGKVTTLVIPNVFGPFGRPFYNSAIATFCHQLTHNQEPAIHVDAELKLIYVGDLSHVFAQAIMGTQEEPARVVHVREQVVRKVSMILEQLKTFQGLYLKKYTIPKLDTSFDLALFNTFRSYIDHKYFPTRLTVHRDDRGYLFENMKAHIGGQTFVSLTRPGVTRGNHYHTRKVERFCVVDGEAIIRQRRIGTKEVIEYHVSGDEPSYVDLPVLHTHNIENVGGDDLTTFFWSNEIYDPENPDTFPEKV